MNSSSISLVRSDAVELVAKARQVVGRSLDAIQSSANSRRFVTAVTSAAPNAHVAIGVGNRPIPGWINTDILRTVKSFLDLSSPWPVPSNAVARIYGDNVIEHFPIDLARVVFRNCAAALGHGGRIRFATPDLERAARAYLEGSEVGREHLARYANYHYVTEHPNDLIRMLFAYEGHWQGYIYDFAALSAELKVAGFENIIRVDPGQSDDPAFKNLESRTEGTFAHMQLVVEASKI